LLPKGTFLVIDRLGQLDIDDDIDVAVSIVLSLWQTVSPNAQLLGIVGSGWNSEIHLTF
jgi:hypothetical protein